MFNRSGSMVGGNTSSGGGKSGGLAGVKTGMGAHTMKKQSAAEKFKRDMMNEKQLDHANKKDIFDSELDKLMKAASRRSGAVQGGEGNVEITDSTKMALEMIAQKNAQKLYKEKKKEMAKHEIKAKYFTGMQGGRIDKNGKVYDAKGQHILTVDQQSGKIKNRNGNVVGKYKSGCSFSEYKLTRLIDKYDSSKIKPMGGLWGTQGNNSGGGNIWGTE